MDVHGTVIKVHGAFWVVFRRIRIFRVYPAVSRISFCWLIFQGFSRLPENPISWTHAMSILQRPHVRSEELANKSLFEVIELDAGWCTRVVSQLPVQIGSIRLQIRTWKATRFFTTNQLPDQMPYIPRVRLKLICHLPTTVTKLWICKEKKILILKFEWIYVIGFSKFVSEQSRQQHSMFQFGKLQCHLIQ